MSLAKLSPRQQEVVNFVEKYQLEFGASPTIKEIREHLKVSSDNSVLKHLDALEKKGVLKREPVPRGIKLLDSVKERLESSDRKLPVMGSVPAGNPAVCEENIESWVSIGESMAPKEEGFFMLKVSGNSMIDAGIHESDLVVVDQKKEPKVNDIVVALIDGENTVKRFIKKDGKTYLQAENPEYQDIYPVQELLVQGVVTGLIRSYTMNL